MPAPKSAKIREAALALARDGLSVRDIEERLKKRKLSMGKSAIAELVRQFRAGTLKHPPAPAAQAAPAPTPKPAQRAAPAPSAEEAEALDAAAVADLDLVQLAEIVRVVDSSLRRATEERDVRVIEPLMRARERLSLLIAKLRPVVPPDPANDPANAVARDLLRERLEQLVESARTSDPALELLRGHLEAAEREAAARRLSDPAAAAPAPPAEPTE